MTAPKIRYRSLNANTLVFMLNEYDAEIDIGGRQGGAAGFMLAGLARETGGVVVAAGLQHLLTPGAAAAVKHYHGGLKT